jgi:hypothetical protein
MVESQPSKLLVASSILVSRSISNVSSTPALGSTPTMGADRSRTDLRTHYLNPHPVVLEVPKAVSLPL